MYTPNTCREWTHTWSYILWCYSLSWVTKDYKFCEPITVMISSTLSSTPLVGCLDKNGHNSPNNSPIWKKKHKKQKKLSFLMRTASTPFLLSFILDIMKNGRKAQSLGLMILNSTTVPPSMAFLLSHLCWLVGEVSSFWTGKGVLCIHQN